MVYLNFHVAAEPSDDLLAPYGPAQSLGPFDRVSFHGDELRGIRGSGVHGLLVLLPDGKDGARWSFHRDRPDLAGTIVAAWDLTNSPRAEIVPLAGTLITGEAVEIDLVHPY